MSINSSPRVFAASFATETNSFSVIPTTVESFRQFGLGTADMPLNPNALLDVGMLKVKAFFEARGGTFFPSLRAFAQPSAPIERATYETLRTQLLQDLRAAMPIDIAYFILHGAMMAEGEYDCEGDILAQVRQIVGPNAVIGAVLDPHAHLTERMRENANILVFFKEYPHTDTLERAEEAAQLCWQTWKGEIHPHQTMRDLRLIRMWPTQNEPVRGFVDKMMALEKAGEALSISFVHGFPWGDSPDVGSKMLVITDGDPTAGDRLAKILGDEIWAMRDLVDLSFLSVDEALDRALAAPEGPIVLADVADNSGGGAAQDSTFILQRMLERNVTDAAVGVLFDPVSVADCFEVGEGKEIELEIGGKHGRASGDPVTGHCEIIALRRNVLQECLGDGMFAPLGDAAWVRLNGIDVVLCTMRMQVYSTDAFTELGLDPGRRHIVVVKSSNHFYASFEKLAKDTLYVTSPGALNMDVTSIPYTKLQRVLWPIISDPYTTER